MVRPLDCFLNVCLHTHIISRLLYIHPWVQLGASVTRLILDSQFTPINNDSERRLWRFRAGSVHSTHYREIINIKLQKIFSSEIEFTNAVSTNFYETYLY